MQAVTNIPSSSILKLIRKVVCVAALLLAWQAPADADAGVPMLIVVWPISWVLLGIIPLEAKVGWKTLKVDHLKALKIASAANIASTLVGIPLIWIVLVILQLSFGGTGAWGIDTLRQKVMAVTLQSPWLIPYGNDLNWMIPAAALVLCIPFYFTSVWVEYLVARRYFTADMRPQIRRWAWFGNAASYALILIWLTFVLIKALHSRGLV